MDDVNGTTMIESTIAAESIPTPSGGPVKSGTDFRDAGVASSSPRTNGTSTKMPQSPYTIEGIAARSSVTNTSGRCNHDGDSSDVKTAIPTATGVAITSARIEEYSVPQMKGRAPNSPETGSHV